MIEFGEGYAELRRKLITLYHCAFRPLVDILKIYIILNVIKL